MTVVWLFMGTFLVCILYAAVTSGLILEDMEAEGGGLKIHELPHDLVLQVSALACYAVAGRCPVLT